MTKDDFNVRPDEDEKLVISMEKKTENKEEKERRQISEKRVFIR